MSATDRIPNPAELGDRALKVVERNRVGRSIVTLIDTLDQHNAVVAASAMAFDAFLSLVPLAAFGGLIMHRLHDSGDLVVGPLFRASPKPVAEIVTAALGRLEGSDAAVVAPLSVLAFVWTTSAGVSTAMAIFEKMFVSPPRPWWWRRLIAMMCVFVSIAIIMAVTSLAVTIGLFSPLLGAFLAWIVPGATLTALLVGFFRVSVRPGVAVATGRPTSSAIATPLPVASFRGRRRVAPGVAVTLTLWSAISVLFSLYVATIARYATLYGQLAAVAIFLLWLWLLALALLVGGEVNAQLDGLREAMPTEIVSVGGMRAVDQRADREADPAPHR